MEEENIQSSPMINMRGASYFSPFKPALVEALVADKAKFLCNDFDENRGRYGKFIYNTLSVDEIADCVLTEMEKAMIGQQHGVKLGALTNELGRSVYRRYFIQRNLALGHSDHTRMIYPEFERVMSDPVRRAGQTVRQVWDAVTSLKLGAFSLEQNVLEPWTMHTHVHVGARLVQLLLETASMAAITGDPADAMAAFYHTYDYQGSQTIGIIKANADFHVRGQKGNTLDFLKGGSRHFDSSLLPMACVPKPWMSIRAGSFMMTPALLMRVQDDAFQHLELLAATAGTGSTTVLKEITDALNYLGSCSWKINEKVLNTLTALYQSEMAYPDLAVPPLHILLPAKPPDYDTNFVARTEYIEKYKHAKKIATENIGIRSELTSRIMIANAV